MTDEELGNFLWENYTFNLGTFCDYVVKDGKVSIYYRERGCDELRKTYDTWQEFVKENGRPKPPADTVDTLKELDEILAEKNKGYKRIFPVIYEYKDGRYFRHYEDDDFDGGYNTRSFKTCDEMARNILGNLSEIPVARSMSLTEILEAQRELDYYGVNYRFDKYTDRKLERSVYTIFTWRKETEKIKDYNWFHDMYYHR